jgi:hypothetical protein
MRRSLEPCGCTTTVPETGIQDSKEAGGRGGGGGGGGFFETFPAFFLRAFFSLSVACLRFILESCG